MPSMNEAELAALADLPPKVVDGEVSDDDEYDLDPEDELLGELRTSRDTLRKCMVLLAFFGTHVDRITAKERKFLAKQEEAIENRLSEIDEVVEKYEEVE